MKFGEILKELRLGNKLTQQELADKLSQAYGQYISRGSVGNWEANTRTPKFEVYEVIADFFNVDMDYLRGNRQSPQPAAADDDAELAEYLEMLRSRPECRLLLKTQKGATKEEVEENVRIIEAIRGHKNS